MFAVRRLSSWFRVLWHRASAEAAVDEELQFHLEQQTAKNIASGLGPSEARRQALIRFGGVTQVKEQAREERGLPWMADCGRDLAYAARRLRRAPGFTIAAGLTLALGIGGSTAIFSVIDTVLLRPLPFTEPDRLAMLRPSSNSRVSAAYVHEWRLRTRAFDDIAAWRDARTVVTGLGDPFEVTSDRTSANFFALLGAVPRLGRSFATAADLNRVDAEVVLSDGLWRRRFGGSPAVIGRTLTLDGTAYTIVGVMPPGFAVRTTELVESRAELWMPFPLRAGNLTGMGGAHHVVARIRRDATFEQAQAEIAAITRRIEQEHPSYSSDWTVGVVPLLEATVADARPTLLLLGGAIAIVLLLASANVATLFLTRALARRPELSARVALGASRGRLTRQLLTEGALLALCGGVGGLAVAITIAATSRALAAGLDVPRLQEVGLNARMPALAFGVTLITIGLCGVIPAFRAVGDVTVASARVASGTGSRPHPPLGGLIVLIEVALAMVLLAGAGLLGRSFWQLQRVPAGFDASGVLTLRARLPALRYASEAHLRVFAAQLLEGVSGLPDVRAVGLVDYLPLSRFGAAEQFEIEGEAARHDPRFAWFSRVDGRFFDAMGIHLVRGRFPQAGEAGVVIDEALARRHFGGGDPVGQRVLWRPGDRQPLAAEIVGVVGDVRWQSLASDPPGAMYWPMSQAPARDLTIVARSAAPPAALSAAIAGAVHGIDPGQPVADIRRLEELVAGDLARPRVTSLMMTAFAGVSLLMAVIGIYSVIASTAAQRTREIGVRVALGATYGDVLAAMMRRGVWLVGSGVALGVGLAVALGRLIAGLLYGISPADAATLAAVAALLAAVGLLATFIPAHRATRVDPAVALRAE